MFMYLNCDLIPTLNYITEHFLLYSTSYLLWNSSFEMDLQFSITICLLFSYTALETVLLLYSAHPAGGFLTDLGDGLLFSKVGSILVGFSTSTNSSPMPQLNWSHLMPEFAGKPDEDVEAHLLRTNDWMDTCFSRRCQSPAFLSDISRRGKVMV